MKKRILPLIAAFGLLGLTDAVANTQTVIGFGSCLHQDKPQPIWQAIQNEPLDAFLLLGDNVYGDTEDMHELRAKYKKQFSRDDYRVIADRVPVYAIWDDHDYGEDDAGKNYPQKEASREILLDTFNVPPGSPRRHRPDGIYTSTVVGAEKQRIQVIMPDLRWNRDDLDSVNRLVYLTSKAPRNLGPYEPHTDPAKVMLGEAQWAWLEEQLQVPADLRIFASSLQLIPEFTGWESWANFPHERQRLFDLLARYQVSNLIFISGDTHWGELSEATINGTKWIELTSSGLTETWKDISPNIHRISEGYAQANYGIIEVDWGASINVRMKLKDADGSLLAQQQLSIERESLAANEAE